MLNFLFVVLFSITSFANATSLSLVDSLKTEEIPLEAYQKSVWFFYTTDCSVCHQQVIEFKCLKKPIKVVGAGFGARRRRLWRETKKLKFSSIKPFRSYVIDNKTFNSLPLKKGLSPQLILFDNGKAIKHFVGLTSCSKVLKEFSSVKRKT